MNTDDRPPAGVPPGLAARVAGAGCDPVNARCLVPVDSRDARDTNGKRDARVAALRAPALLLGMLIGMLIGAGVSVAQAQPAGAAQPPASAAPLTAPAARPDAARRNQPDAPNFLREWQLPELASLSRAELEALLLPWLGRNFGAVEQLAVRKAVSAALEARGLALGGVALRPLPGRPGAWLLQVIEPRLRRIEFAPGVDQPLSDAHVRSVLAAQGVAPGALLDLRALDQSLYHLNDLPGVSASATLAPSGDEGVYDLVVERSLRNRVEGSVEADNHGSRFNGRNRIGALLRVNEPFDLGDNLDARLLVSQGRGLVTGRLSYELPLAWRSATAGWDSGWRASAGVSSLRYELGDSLADLDAHGRAHIVDLGLSRPLQRSRQFNLIGRLSASHKSLQDHVFGVVVDKRSSDLSGALSFESRDEALGGGYNGGLLNLAAGRLHIDSASESAADRALGQRATQGSYLKLTTQLSRLQALPALGTGWSFYSGLSAQWASRNLDSSEKFALGGAQAVRGYAPGEAAADAGLITTFELRRPLGAHWSVFGLFDWGYARAQIDPAPGVDNSRTLNARGLGLFFSDPELFTLRAVLAWRGSSPSLSEPSASTPRLNLQLTRGF
jgi:hemolysin activation/secretion protein